VTRPSASAPGGFDPAYEWRAVLLLSLAFGLVGLDRWILPPLFPAMMADLGLNYADLGNLVGVLALSWGIAAIAIGRLSDKVGRRKVLLPALIGFSLLSGLTGVANGVAALLLVRGLMGVGEGAFLPASVAATSEASHPRRRGLNQGMQMSSFALMGFGFAPIIATQMLRLLPSWRAVFLLVAVPGLVIALFLFRLLREPPHIATGHVPAAQGDAAATPWSLVIKAHNIRVAILGLLCTMSCIFVMGAMVPNYLVDHLKLAPTEMGFIMSAMGWGGFVGEWIMPGLSDHIGRRAASILSFAGAWAATWMFARTGADSGLLFLWLGCVSFFCIGLLGILTGPVAVEAVPPALAASAIGVVSGTGEIFGGGIAPIMTGHIAQGYGITAIFWVPLIGLALGFLILFALRETAPRRAGIGS